MRLQNASTFPSEQSRTGFSRPEKNCKPDLLEPKLNAVKRVIVIGSGFAGLSAAACLAHEGFEVTVFEKNATAGGRARQFQRDGYTFDMGPSWYWMPDVFERFFNRFGKHAADYYKLERLDPSYRIYFAKNDFMDVPAGIEPLTRFFEEIEPGSGSALKEFLKESEHKYAMGMQSLVYKPGLSFRELADISLLKNALRLHIFQSLSRYVRKFFKDPRLISMLEFPVLFLGAPAQKIPALYSLMNYADMALGTWYPKGGMYKVVEAMTSIALEQGVTFSFNSPITSIQIAHGMASGVTVKDKFHAADFIVGAADYQHIENDLLDASVRQYSERYWEERTLAPSCLIFYVGLNKRVAHLLHHTLFFDENLDKHLAEIYTDPRWPTAPQFYVSCPSKTDDSVAPDGCENLFILIPVAPGLRDEAPLREKYFNMVMRRIEAITGEDLLPHVVFRQSYAHNDFSSDYNAFKGNAYGLANTWRQTANLKPRMASAKVKNLFFAGQLTAPGPGVPPAIISGQVAAEQVIRSYRSNSKQSGRYIVK